MGTTNFATENASKHFVVYNNGEFDEFNDSISNIDYLLWKKFEKKKEGEEYSQQEDSRMETVLQLTQLRSYPQKLIRTLEPNFFLEDDERENLVATLEEEGIKVNHPDELLDYIENQMMEIEIPTISISGYYEHATLDWAVAHYQWGETQLYNNTSEELVELCASIMDESAEKYMIETGESISVDTGNEDNIIVKYLSKVMGDKIAAYAMRIEDVFAQNADMILCGDMALGNGETIYFKCEEEKESPLSEPLMENNFSYQFSQKDIETIYESEYLSYLWREYLDSAASKEGSVVISVANEDFRVHKDSAGSPILKNKKNETIYPIAAEDIVSEKYAENIPAADMGISGQEQQTHKPKR